MQINDVKPKNIAVRALTRASPARMMRKKYSRKVTNTIYLQKCIHIWKKK